MIIKNGNYTVYIHISPNYKYYVGITSRKPKKRWKSGYGYSTQTYFYRAIEKYGWKNFKHEIIATNLTKEEACNFEVLLINKLQSNNYIFGYNQSLGGESGSLGTTRTEEQKNKMRKNRLKSIKQYSLDGEYIKTWNSVKEAGECLGIKSYSNISSCLSGKLKMVGNYIWRNIDDETEIIKYTPKIQQVSQYNLLGEYLKSYATQGDAARDLNISVGGITQCCKNKLNSHGGFIWRYYDNQSNIAPYDNKDKIIYQFLLDGTYIKTWKSLKDASESIGISSYGNLIKCLKEQRNSCCGYKWKYAD